VGNLLRVALWTGIGLPSRLVHRRTLHEVLASRSLTGKSREPDDPQSWGNNSSQRPWLKADPQAFGNFP